MLQMMHIRIMLLALALSMFWHSMTRRSSGLHEGAEAAAESAAEIWLLVGGILWVVWCHGVWCVVVF